MNKALIFGLIAPYLPAIQETLEFMEELDIAHASYKRNKWVQEIKKNYRRNKRKRRRCKK